MELENLKEAWTTTNIRLDALQQVVVSDRTTMAGNLLRREPIIELVVAIFAAIWSGGFIADNLAGLLLAPLMAIPGCLIYALSVFTIVISARQLVAISKLDYSNPIIETQKAIAGLRKLRVRSTQFMLLIALPLWLVFPIFALQSVVGFDIGQRAGDKLFAAVGPWFLANFVFGVVVSAGFILAARKFGETSPFLTKFNDVLAGDEILRAERILSEVRSFEVQ